MTQSVWPFLWSYREIWIPLLGAIVSALLRRYGSFWPEGQRFITGILPDIEHALGKELEKKALGQASKSAPAKAPKDEDIYG